MNNCQANLKLWDHETVTVDDWTVKVDRVADMRPEQHQAVYQRFNDYGVVIVEHAPTGEDPVEELHALNRLFGEPVTHDRADERGLVVVGELTGYGEFVGASSGPHLMHTGGTFMPWDLVPKIVALQCVRQARIGGRSLLSSGAAGYRYLQREHPWALKLLCSDEAFSIVRSAAGRGRFGGTGGTRKAVFDDTRLPEQDHLWLSFRFDGQVKLEFVPDETHEAYELLLDFFNRSENQVDFKLQPNQILVCDNTSVVHARTAYQAGSGRKLNRLQFDGENENLVFGFPRPPQ